MKNIVAEHRVLHYEKLYNIQVYIKVVDEKGGEK